MNAAAFSVLPLKRYAEFHGRSTRGELAAFYVLVIITNVVIGYLGVAIGFEAQQWVQSGLSLLLLCPTAALGVRRLHDSGWSGWWLMLGLPATAVGTWEFFSRPGPWSRPIHLE
ncbi:DUF805 domain-containing protein, partial [Allosphingosinicella sp.]|uniref:DUF805 domain-containing protein n=1 Tax=Allosphingosinicella sp. TaxID=2823234 RepID=UPI003784C3B1